MLRGIHNKKRTNLIRTSSWGQLQILYDSEIHAMQIITAHAHAQYVISNAKDVQFFSAAVSTS